MLSASHLAIAYVVTEWAIRIGMILIIPWRRPAEATRSWLLLGMFVPIPALILYRLIGRVSFPGWRQRLFADTEPARRAVAAALPEGDPEGGGQRAGGLIRLAHALGGFPACSGNTVALSDDYERTVGAMVAAIDSARTRVHLLTYIFADDDTGIRLADALGRAKERGVETRVLIDALGSRKWSRGTLEMLQVRRVDAQLVLPVRFAPLRRARGDLRNHRKFLLIDGHTAFVGSQNIVDRDFRPGIVNDDLVARVEGPVVAALEAVFASDWYMETEQPIEPLPIPSAMGDVTIQPMPSGPDFGVPGYERLLIELVHGATRHVAIVSPYLIPDEGLLTAMKNAVARGVTVEVIVSMVVDQTLVNLAQRSYYDELLRGGVQLYRYQHRLLHAKSVAIDGRIALIGSSNADVRSFQLNAEISLLIYDREVDAALGAIHRRYIGRSELLTLAQWRERSGLVRLAENLARLVGPLL